MGVFKGCIGGGVFNVGVLEGVGVLLFYFFLY